MTQWHGGKGSKYRPVDTEKFSKGYDRIWKKKKKKKASKSLDSPSEETVKNEKPME